jgi:hypothetical protein
MRQCFDTYAYDYDYNTITINVSILAVLFSFVPTQDAIMHHSPLSLIPKQLTPANHIEQF